MNHTCRHCQHTNPPWAQFCGMCGLSIETRTDVAPPPPPVESTRHLPPVPAANPRRGSRIFLSVAIVGFIALGWIWVMAPRSNRHVNPPAALSAHPAQTWSNRDGRKEMYYVVGTKLSEALYELLIPEHVPIAVSRDSDGRRISIRGTAEQVAAMDRFVEQLTMGEPAYYTGPHPKQTMDYELTKDQARAMADALDAANRRFSVSRKGATVRVHGDQSLHDAIHDLLQYIRPQRQTMVDISRRSDW